jgi:hypothetical protein
VELLFLCNSEEYAETVPGTSIKEYPKYSYVPHKAGRKPQYIDPASQNLTELSRETPFVFKGDPGSPRTSIPAKITPISRHQHIKTITRGYCLIYKNSDKRIARQESIVYKTVLKLSGDTLEEVTSLSREEEGPKRIRGTETV